MLCKLVERVGSFRWKGLPLTAWSARRIAPGVGIVDLSEIAVWIF